MNLNQQVPDPLSDYRTIPLSRGMVAIVDAADFDWLNQWKWSALKGKKTWYAARTVGAHTKNQRMILMHRLILGMTDRKVLADHWDNDGLNNRRYNLRQASPSQNGYNQKGPNVSNRSGFLGVSWYKRGQCWRPRITVEGRAIYLGYCDTAAEAARVRDRAALQYHGEFAKLNFPQELERRKAEAVEERPMVQ